VVVEEELETTGVKLLGVGIRGRAGQGNTCFKHGTTLMKWLEWGGGESP
jgi:hypothetical protein